MIFAGHCGAIFRLESAKGQMHCLAEPGSLAPCRNNSTYLVIATGPSHGRPYFRFQGAQCIWPGPLWHRPEDGPRILSTIVQPTRGYIFTIPKPFVEWLHMGLLSLSRITKYVPQLCRRCLPGAISRSLLWVNAPKEYSHDIPCGLQQ